MAENFTLVTWLKDVCHNENYAERFIFVSFTDF